MSIPSSLTTVTRFSLFLALFLLIALPLAGFRLGVEYQSLQTAAARRVHQVFPTQAECEARTQQKCSPIICDHIPSGKTLAEVCGSDFQKGWAPNPQSNSTPDPIDTSNWQTYSNHLYNFSFKYPTDEKNLYYAFGDNGFFELSSDRRNNPHPWLYITWKPNPAASITDYITSQCTQLYRDCLMANGQPIIEQRQFGDQTFSIYKRSFSNLTAETYVTQLPGSDSLLQVYVYDFPNSIRDAVMNSFSTQPINPPDTFTYRSSTFEITAPSSWGHSESWEKNYINLQKDPNLITFRALQSTRNNARPQISFQEQAKEMNQYKFSSTAWGDNKTHTTGPQKILIDGETGYRFDWERNPPEAIESWIYIQHQQQFYEIGLSGDDPAALEDILSTFRFLDTQILSPTPSSSARQACSDANGYWLSEHSECTGINQVQCQAAGGTFEECASSCRHDPQYPNVPCILLCVPVCAFSSSDKPSR